MAGRNENFPKARCQCWSVKDENGCWTKSPGIVAKAKEMRNELLIEQCCCCQGHPGQLGGFTGHTNFQLAA